MSVRKRKYENKFGLLLLSLFICLLLSGCGKKDIFVDESKLYELTALSDDELTDDNYYVKNGADFYAVYKPEGSASGIVNSPTASRLFWMNKDKSLIPSLYKDELIAFPSEKTNLTEIRLERFEEVGWSLGFYGGYMDDQGYICYSIGQNCIKGSDAYEKLNDKKSDNIRIVSINDEPVTKEMLNDAGVITGLEKDGQYVIGLYAGTYYGTITLTADRYFVESFEIMSVPKANDTRNGYLAIYMPDEFPSGWYAINGKGLFKYYNYKKGDDNDEEVDMNQAYYQTLADSMEAYAQQYVASVEEKTENVLFSVRYATDVYSDEEVTAVLIAPDGTQYGMTSENGVAYTEISDVMAGRWKISVMPQDLEITNVTTESTKPEMDAVHEEREFIIEEDDANIQFYATYTGNGEVWGTVENQNGESRILDADTQNKFLTTTYAYLPAGTYKVTVYHYVDTQITDIGYGIDGNNVEEEIITITE